MITYDDELTRTRQDITTLESKVRPDSANLVERIRLAYRRYHLASLTEDERDYQSVETTLSALIQDFDPQEDVCLLQANVDGHFHRLHKAKQTLAGCPRLAQRPSARAVLADIDFQEGRYQACADTLNALLEENRTWDILARLAHWKGKMGAPDEADQLYADAEDELTAKEMRSLAWLELQRGSLALSRGKLHKARAHYERAQAAFPGHWRTDAHRVALLAAEENLAAAETLLRSVIDRSPKPEYKQALGELLAKLDRNEESHAYLKAAESDFLVSVRQGGVHYFHHLTDIYADALNQPAEAVRWARKDLELRCNFSTQSALAWALYKNGQAIEAQQWIRLALSSGVQDSNVFWTASTVFHAAGNATEGEHYHLAAKALNPLDQHIHLHC